MSSKIHPSTSDTVETEFAKLKRDDPKYAARVERMELSEAQRDFVAYTVKKTERRKVQGDELYKKGRNLYAIQIVCSALVPVLIGIIGSFPDPSSVAGTTSLADTTVRIVAIALSIVGTICAAIESVYHNRHRGEQIRRLADQMNGLFQEYDTLSGPRFATEEERRLPSGGLAASAEVEAPSRPVRTHGGLAFRIYSEAFNALQERVRDAQFLSGAPASGDGSGSSGAAASN